MQKIKPTFEEYTRKIVAILSSRENCIFHLKTKTRMIRKKPTALRPCPADQITYNNFVHALA